MIEGLKPERDYRFRIRAKTPTGLISEPSPAVSLYTALGKSTGFLPTYHNETTVASLIFIMFFLNKCYHTTLDIYFF